MDLLLRLLGASLPVLYPAAMMKEKNFLNDKRKI